MGNALNVFKKDKEYCNQTWPDLLAWELIILMFKLTLVKLVSFEKFL